MKRVLLAFMLAGAFLVGYAGVAKAIGVPGLAEYEGYFHGRTDYNGDYVLNSGIPTSVNSATEFINFIKNKLNNGSTQDRVGAAFIIQTMIGTSRRLPPSGAQIADWEARVRYAAANGRVDWRQTYSYSVNSYYQDAHRDDAFYGESGSESAILFKNASGRVVYAIKHRCANPVGRVDALDRPNNYTITARSTVSDTTATPGQQVTFRHYVRNSGPDTATGINWRANNPLTSPDTNIANGTVTLGNDVERQVNAENFRVPANAAIGTRYCRYVFFWPAHNGSGDGRSANACTTVVGDFELQPSVNASAATAAQGDQITFTYSVYNEGPTAAGPNITCKATANVRPSGWTPLPKQDADRNSDPGQTAPPINCPTGMANRATYTQTETITVGNVPPGSRICRSLVVSPRNENGGPRASAESCVVIAKVPYVHFMGNDVWAGGGFGGPTASCTGNSKIQSTAQRLPDGSSAGSVSEYGAFALGKIIGFGSASKPLVDAGATAGKVLSFSNMSPHLGEFNAPRHCINDYEAQYSGTAQNQAPGAYDVAARGSGVWHVAGSAQIRGNMPAGATQVYIIDGDLTINGNIGYPASHGSVAAIPSLVLIVKGNITVQSGVTQIDGMFVAKGNFNTCDPPAGNLSVSICNTQLIVNGPVIAGKLNLLRTYGAAGATPDQRKAPAEVFRFSTEFYLRNGLFSPGGVMRVVDQKDLPPRF